MVSNKYLLIFIKEFIDNVKENNFEYVYNFVLFIYVNFWIFIYIVTYLQYYYNKNRMIKKE